MPRPLKWRCVSFIPEVVHFIPQGIPPGEEVCLSVEEAEAIRLKDTEGLDQEECAQRMRISRPTFHRLLESARKKIADALLNGKAIRIEGGNFELAMRQFRCNNDGHEWQVPFETMISDPPKACPECDSPNIQPIPPFGFGWGRGGYGRPRFRGGRR